MRELRMHITRYCNSTNKEWNFYKNGLKLLYILREEAILKHSRKSENQSITSFLNATRLENPENEGLISFDFLSKKTNFPKINDVLDQFASLNEKQFIWDGSISLNKKNLDELNFGTQNDFAELIHRYMPSFLKTEGLDPENINFYGAVHANTDNIHLHFIFFEKEKQIYDEKTKKMVFKKKGKLNLTNIKTFEFLSWKYLTNKKEQIELFDLKKEFWSNKNEIKKSLKNLRFEQMNEHALTIINEIRTKNIKNYKNLSNDSKLAVQKYFENQLQDLPPEIQKKYDNHIKFLDKFPNDKHFLKEKAGFETWIGNKVINDLKTNYASLNYEIKPVPEQQELIFKNISQSLKIYLNKYDYQRIYKYLNHYRKIQYETEKEKQDISNSS